jgi:RimJ/RimL family protein N-acetyltransferase
MENVVYKEIVDGLSVLIRYPESGDTKIMCDYINEISQEKTYITWQGEEISLEHEDKYLKKQIERIKKNETVQLLLFVDGELSGISAIDLGNRVKSHIGVFGITITQKYRGKGFGKLLMKLILEQASKNLPKLKLVTLEVFAENKKAIYMYEKFGFVEYGKLPGGNLYKGKMVDDIQMYKNA